MDAAKAIPGRPAKLAGRQLPVAGITSVALGHHGASSRRTYVPGLYPGALSNSAQIKIHVA